MSIMDAAKGRMGTKQKDKIPGQVIFNQMKALSSYLEFSFHGFDFEKNYNKKSNINNIPRAKNLLHNSWATEIALIWKLQNIDEDFYKYQIQWNFPQLYYSVFLSFSALTIIKQGDELNDHNKAIRRFSSEIKSKQLPDPISFAAYGNINNLKLLNISRHSKNYSNLTRPKQYEDYEYHITKLLSSTRKKEAKRLAKKYKSNNGTPPEFKKNDKTPYERYNKNQWNILYSKLKPTTILNILYRFRIKSNYHNIDSFLNADFNFNIFHDSLCNIANYVLLALEYEIVKTLGKDIYKSQFLDEFPNKDLKALQRFEEHFS